MHTTQIAVIAHFYRVQTLEHVVQTTIIIHIYNIEFHAFEWTWTVEKSLASLFIVQRALRQIYDFTFIFMAGEFVSDIPMVMKSVLSSPSTLDRKMCVLVWRVTSHVNKNTRKCGTIIMRWERISMPPAYPPNVTITACLIHSKNIQYYYYYLGLTTRWAETTSFCDKV